MTALNYRKTIIDKLIPYFRENSHYCLLVGDMGFGAIDRLNHEFPDRVYNCGVMEQGMVGIAAGMSMASMIPIVYSIVNFLAFRAIEQIRNDVMLQDLNVKFIGTGANDYFRFLGESHCCGNDDIKVMNLIKMKVYDPYSISIPFDALVKSWIEDEKAGYIRV